MTTAEQSHDQQQDAENHSRFGVPAKLQRYEQIIGTFTSMTDSEKAELAAWEKIHLPGDGSKGTSDWPRWDEIIDRANP